MSNMSCSRSAILFPALSVTHAPPQVDSVPAGRLLWQLTWDQMLCVELAYHSQQRSAAPDGVIVHRKYRQGDEVLVHDVRCTPNTNQVRAAVDNPPCIHGVLG